MKQLAFICRWTIWLFWLSCRMKHDFFCRKLTNSKPFIVCCDEINRSCVWWWNISIRITVQLVAGKDRHDLTLKCKRASKKAVAKRTFQSGITPIQSLLVDEWKKVTFHILSKYSPQCCLKWPVNGSAAWANIVVFQARSQFSLLPFITSCDITSLIIVELPDYKALRFQDILIVLWDLELRTSVS